MAIDALVIRRMPAREHDQMVVLYAQPIGKCVALAKGALRQGSKQAFALDDGNLIRCELVPSRSGMAIMTGAQSQRCWAHAKESPLAWSAAGAMLQMLDVLTWDAQPDERVWQTALGAFAALDAGGDPLVTMRQCQAALLHALGYGVQPMPRAGAVRTPLDDAIERIAQRTLGGPELVYRLVGSGQ